MLITRVIWSYFGFRTDQHDYYIEYEFGRKKPEMKERLF